MLNALYRRSARARGRQVNPETIIIPTPTGARHGYKLAGAGGQFTIEEYDPRTGSNRHYRITESEAAIVSNAPEAERHAIAWRLYHVARLRTRSQAGGTYAKPRNRRP
jgi:hypothetical protein